MFKRKFGKYCSEAFGTFCLVFFGTAAIVVNDVSHGQLGNLGVSLVFGSVVLIMVYALGHISGAHFNPAVTIGFLSVKKISLKEAVIYILFQLSGAVLASVMVSVLFAEQTTTLGNTFPTASWQQTFLTEVILTCVLMIVILAVSIDERANRNFAGVAIGATVTIAALVGGPISGASMNPARSFAPALMSGVFSDHWLYWVGPISGALIGSLLYKLLQCPSLGPNREPGCC